MAKLRAQHQLFVDEYLIDLNGTQAAIRAAYAVKSASTTAVRLLGNPKIQAAIDKGIAARKNRLELSQDRVVLELLRLAMSDMRNVAAWTGDSVSLTPSDEISDDAAAAVTEVTITTTTRQFGETTVTEHKRKIKLADKTKALQLLGQHLGMFQEQPASGQEIVYVPRRTPRLNEAEIVETEATP